MTQSDRLLAYLRANPGASSLMITHDLAIVNVTGRVSDLRARGIVIEAKRDAAGIFRYRVAEDPVQLGLAL
mgnify:CR=1 FL=1